MWGVGSVLDRPPMKKALTAILFFLGAGVFAAAPRPCQLLVVGQSAGGLQGNEGKRVFTLQWETLPAAEGPLGVATTQTTFADHPVARIEWDVLPQAPRPLATNPLIGGPTLIGFGTAGSIGAYSVLQNPDPKVLGNLVLQPLYDPTRHYSSALPVVGQGTQSLDVHVPHRPRHDIRDLLVKTSYLLHAPGRVRASMLPEPPLEYQTRETALADELLGLETDYPFEATTLDTIESLARRGEEHHPGELKEKLVELLSHTNPLSNYRLWLGSVNETPAVLVEFNNWPAATYFYLWARP